MVELNKKAGSTDNSGFAPMMHTHKLISKMDSGPFKKGELVVCFIAHWDSKYAVWDNSYGHHNKYKCYSKQELHDTFDELSD